MPPTNLETNTPTAPAMRATKRAFAYLRVSSESQVRTDYSDDGLSIDAQREGTTDKAIQLDAKVVQEFSDPGRSAYVDLHKRTGFLTMLDELKRRNEHASTRVDYVIVWALNRWARNQRDHWQTRELVRQAGAKLVSITEPMIGDDSAAAFLYESMIATQNQFQSMQTSENVKRGMRQKASVGGTYNAAPFGYLNDVDNLPDGRRVNIVTTDPERSHYATLIFQLYASGEYSGSQLVAELNRLGVRTRPTAKRPARALGTSTIQRILRSPYYTGKIVYKRGTPDEQTFEGRHEPLIDQDTFDIVQRLLDEKRVAAERPQKHRPYLRGTIFCGTCRKRLVYGISRGRNGDRYAYFFCTGRINGTGCQQRLNFRPVLIEQAIQHHYVAHPIQLTAQDVQRRSEAIRAMAAVSQEAVVQVRQAKTELIRSLEARQEALVDMRFAEKSISPTLFKRKQEQLQAELDAAHESLAESERRLQIDERDMEMALELAENVGQVYAEASEQTRRSLNQAFFKRLFIVPEWDDDGHLSARIAEAELTEPYALLLGENFAAEVTSEAETIKARADTERAPRGRTDRQEPASAAVSYFNQMVRQSRPYPNGQAGVEALVEMLLHPVDRRLRRKLLGE
ncbi:MAG: recombinase family protein [Solirubrobacteraceae bacterium]